MKHALFLALAASLLAVSAHADLPEGSFRGRTPALRGDDVMALIVRRDAGDARKGYAVLSEYTRVPYIPGPERLEITRWVPRMYIFRVEETSAHHYAFRPLHVSGAGALELDNGYSHAGELVTVHGGDNLIGAVLTRYDKTSLVPAETITFDGNVSSTWQPYVAAEFFASHDATGGDYFHHRVNTVLRPDHVGVFSQPDITGDFRFTEAVPGIWLLTPLGAVTGQNLVATRIAVFIDIVNWKPFFTTNELMLINPDNARDVGFYYQRH
jgi:hypothetical protein